jgi:hypothetical protein
MMLENWSITKLWHHLNTNPVIKAIAGFKKDEKIPSYGTFANFISRLVPIENKKIHSKLKEPNKKTIPKKKGEKIPEKKQNAAELAINFIRKHPEHLKQMAELTMSLIFRDVTIKQSITQGLLPDNIEVSFDGSCIRSGGNSCGKKICECSDPCECKRKYSDGNATFGYDSHERSFYFGYNNVQLNYRNEKLKIDLPLYNRLVQGGRHDSVPAMPVLREFQLLHQGKLTVTTFIADSACDNYPTYEFLDELGIQSVIDLNLRRSKNGDIISDTPICEHCGGKMKYWGFKDQTHRMKKWKCPLAYAGHPEECPYYQVSPVKTGRVAYTSCDDNLRFHPQIPRESAQWRELKKHRSSIERNFGTMMLTYDLHHSKYRSKATIYFLSVIANMCIHLKYQNNIMTA